MSDNLIGQVVTAEVLSKTANGFLLNYQNTRIFLPKESVKGPIGDEVDVFLYNDNNGQIIASLQIPTILSGTYDWVTVVKVVAKLGVFVDIGMQKDILVSMDDLPLFERAWPNEGDRLFVTLSNDRRGRLIALPVKEEMIEEERDRASLALKGSEIEGHIYRVSKVGSFMITEQGYRGFIHEYERKREPRLGEFVKGRVIDVKEDGSLNVTLRSKAQESQSQDADEILAYLERSGGLMPYTDKSDPDEIREQFKISKASFKRALGKLMKDGKIKQEDGQTTLVE
ncbi:hypothetical protein FLK61_31680 [Paenalkalicoccus suaedae]|uniref:S1 motif domain-containing protein n=1 Tax=Paenalkalicoccus suaedae TaxID=2592382 RepID=A0A859FEZ6_9BACI|nr:S1-like domain-containing RNA-binding protein [Paenalkalicoccus suaedae]QKS71272.1 hypothetical protein FLK61_31680 [Paenalkalicoccus suaedae]